MTYLFIFVSLIAAVQAFAVWTNYAERPYLPDPDTPMWRAIQWLGKRLGDSADHDFYSNTRLCIRQAACDGRIVIWGRREIVDRDNPGHCRDDWTPIPAEYWYDNEINRLATDEDWWEHDHTWVEAGYHGRDRCWALHVHFGSFKRTNYPGLVLKAVGLGDLA